MKIYSITCDLNKPTLKRIFVPPYSDFKVGVRAFKNGIEVSPDEISIDGYDADEELYQNKFKVWPIRSETQNITLNITAGNQKFKCKVTVTGSSVFDVNVNGSQPTPPTPTTCNCFYFENISENIGQITQVSNYGLDNSFEYSFDGNAWTQFENVIENVQPNSKVYIRARSYLERLNDSTQFSPLFVPSFECNIGGKLLSLLDKDCDNPLTTVIPDYCFFYLFNNISLIHVNEDFELPALEYEGIYTCCNMFYEDTFLETVPQNLFAAIPDELFNLEFTFYRCLSLKTTPTLRAATMIDPYSSAFSGCQVLEVINTNMTRERFQNVVSTGQDVFTGVPDNCKVICTDGEYVLSDFYPPKKIVPYFGSDGTEDNLLGYWKMDDQTEAGTAITGQFADEVDNNPIFYGTSTRTQGKSLDFVEDETRPW